MNKIIQIVNTSDIKLLYVINDRIKCKLLDRTLPPITNIGGAIITILTCLVLILLGKGKDIKKKYLRRQEKR